MKDFRFVFVLRTENVHKEMKTIEQKINAPFDKNTELNYTRKEHMDKCILFHWWKRDDQTKCQWLHLQNGNQFYFPSSRMWRYMSVLDVVMQIEYYIRLLINRIRIYKCMKCKKNVIRIDLRAKTYLMKVKLSLLTVYCSSLYI